MEGCLHNVVQVVYLLLPSFQSTKPFLSGSLLRHCPLQKCCRNRGRLHSRHADVERLRRLFKSAQFRTSGDGDVHSVINRCRAVAGFFVHKLSTTLCVVSALAIRCFFSSVRPLVVQLRQHSLPMWGKTTLRRRFIVCSCLNSRSPLPARLSTVLGAMRLSASP